MSRHVQLLSQPEFQVFVFCLMFSLLNWPFLAVSAKNGLMSVFLYLFLLNFILVLLLFLIQRSLREDESGEDRDEEGGD